MSSEGLRRSVGLAAVTAVALLALLAPPRASAHASYEDSMPRFGEVLDAAPVEISIRFTQELFRREGANELRLEQIEGGVATEWSLATPEISNDDRRVMRAALNADLPPGRYLVTWTNLSAEDGDTDSGAYPFYVGRKPSPDEVELDRELASELLIVYPGDEEDEPAAAAPSRVPAVVRADVSDAPGLGAGPVVWLVVGGLAALVLSALLARSRLRLRRTV